VLPRIVPPERPLGRLAFVTTFVRNPLAVVPRAAYEEDFVPGPAARRGSAWVTGPALVRQVLLDERDKFQKLSQIRLLSPLLGKGILTSEGADWRWQRQASSPMFRREDLLGFVPTFVRSTQKLLEAWRADGGREAGVRPIDRDMSHVTFDVISATLLPSADAEVGSTVQRSLETFQKTAGWDILFALARVPQWMPRPGFIAGGRAVVALRRAVGKMVDERRLLAHVPDDLMSRLMRARDPETGQAMNDEQLIDNLLTFYLAGHETTARALTWTLYLLARFPEWMEKLSEEVFSITRGAPVAAEHIDKLVLVQQVLKEAMRLYPPVPLMSRQAVAETTLAGHTLPLGTSVVMPIYVIHRHRKRWERPDDFEPERFAPEREAAIERYQYMPFGAGPRICIGRAFAEIEATAMLATMLQHARFAPAGHHPQPVARVTLLPQGGMPLRVTLH